MKCDQDTCVRDAVARGWCLKHYRRWRRNGSPAEVQRFSGDHSLEDRFQTRGRAVRSNGCWDWLGSIDKQGYGVLYYDNRDLRAHRVAYELYVRPLKDSEILRHTCDNPLCVNPEHLVPGTQEENMQDMVDRKRFHAKVTADDVLEIRQRLEQGESQTALAKEFGLSQSGIWHIKERNTWRSI